MKKGKYHEIIRMLDKSGGSSHNRQMMKTLKKMVNEISIEDDDDELVIDNNEINQA